MRRTYTWALALLCYISCVPLIREAPTPTEPPISIWQPVNAINSLEPIQKIYASYFNEIHFLTSTRYFRLNDDLTIRETRILYSDSLLNIMPSISDKIFARFSMNPVDKRQIMELHLRHGEHNVKYISTGQMIDTIRGESFEFDRVARHTGCFNKDGTKYMLTGVLYPHKKPYVLLFDIQLNTEGDNFKSIRLYKKIILSNLSLDKTETCRHLGNNFYIATKEGGYRITNEGQVKKILNQPVLDFFEYKGKIYATSPNASNFSISTNNGLTWQNEGLSDLKYVETKSDKVFSQIVQGQAYNIADSSLLKIKPIVYNSEFKDKYFNIEYFKGKYFINVGEKVFMLKELKTK